MLLYNGENIKLPNEKLANVPINQTTQNIVLICIEYFTLPPQLVLLAKIIQPTHRDHIVLLRVKKNSLSMGFQVLNMMPYCALALDGAYTAMPSPQNAKIQHRNRTLPC